MSWKPWASVATAALSDREEEARERRPAERRRSGRRAPLCEARRPADEAARRSTSSLPPNAGTGARPRNAVEHLLQKIF